jgi:hypothetical protein
MANDQEAIRTEKPRKLRENGDFVPAASQENPVSPQFIFGTNSPTRENAEKNGRMSGSRKTNATRKSERNQLARPAVVSRVRQNRMSHH